jgi:hypothetical protein
MSTVLTRTDPARPRALSEGRCAGCMEGQGRVCACRGEAKSRHRSWCISQAEFWRLYLALVVGVVGALVWWGLS